MPVDISFGSILPWLTPAYFFCLSVDEVMVLTVDAAVAFFDGVAETVEWRTCTCCIGSSSGGGGDFLGNVAFLKIVSTGAAGPWYGETSIVFDASGSGG